MFGCCDKLVELRLVIIHNHFRPGGVRRVIELAAPCVARELAFPPAQVVLVSGEKPDAAWLARLQASMRPVIVACKTDRALAYLVEQRERPEVILHRLRRFLNKLFDDAADPECVVWIHNPGLGRNLLLARELQLACGRRNLPLLFHHHDWWFDNRWGRWPEMRRAGPRNLSAVARLILPVSPNVRQVAINRSDAVMLRKHFGNHSAWLPNPADDSIAERSASHSVRPRSWLTRTCGVEAPVWLMPCRLLRRKNIAEALLLTRWLRPGALLVTTGGPTSAEERAYASRLSTLATEMRWPLRLAVLEGAEAGQPSVADLMAASEAVLLTSLQEGFGLAYLEAASAGRPLIARALPNVMPDLAHFGFHFPQRYTEILVAPGLFDWGAEAVRQQRLAGEWRKQLPSACRRWAGTPPLLLARRRPAPVPFNRLTLTAQLEVLAAPVEHSWKLCVPLNPFLREWRRLAERQALRVTHWPRGAGKWLSGAAYARRFRRILRAAPTKAPDPSAGVAAQEALIRQKLVTENLYPLAWAADS